MADDINKINDEINKLRAELRKKPLKPFDEKDLENAKQLLSGLRAEIREMSNDLDYVSKSFKDSVNELSNQKSYLSDAKKSLNGIASIAKTISDYRRGESSLDEKQLKNLQNKARIQFEELNYIKQVGNLSKLNQEELIRSLEEQDAFNKSLEKTIKAQKTVNKEIGLVGTGIKGVSNALSKMGFGDFSQPLTEAIEKTKNARLQTILNNDAIAEGKEKYEENAKELKKLSGLGRPLNDAEKERKKSLQDSNKELKANEKSLISQNKELSTQTSKYKNIGNALKDQLTKANLIDFAIKEMVSALTSADKATGELAKSFGTSYSEASSLRNELNTIANLSGDVNINTAELQKSLIAINKEFGTAAMLDGELLKDFTQLTKVVGLTEEAALGLSKTSVATGTDLSDNTAEILGQAIAFNAVNGLALNEKEIVEGVAKASAATTLSLGMQPKALAKAVAQSKALGVSLQQVENISQSLLDFESSISSELEAELLTGKDLNLEKARTAALNGDIATVAQEIAKQTGSAKDFTESNVIQQEALAKAVGMTREDLAASLIQREALAAAGLKEGTAIDAYNKLKKEGLSDDQIAKKLGSDKLADQLKSQSVQERFNASVEKLREIFISLAEPVLQIISPFMDLATTILPLINVVLTPITGAIKFLGESVKFVVDGFSSLINFTSDLLKPFISISGIINNIQESFNTFKQDNEGLFKILGAIGDAFKGFLGTFILLIGAVKTFKAIQKSSFLIDIGKMVVGGIRAAFSLPGPLGLITGLAATAGMIALGSNLYNQFKGDDVISPGYGKRTLFGPEGSIQLNNKDTVIAGTNLEGNSNSSVNSQSVSPSINLTPLIERMSAVENILTQIFNKEGIVYLDGQKVGTTMALGNYKTQ
jgi:hypothetical protein